MSSPHDGLNRLADRLQSVVDEIDEIAFDQLREAAAAKRGRPESDRRLTQARRALEKAIHLLRDPAASGLDE